MLIQLTDFNNADEVIRRKLAKPWRELERVISAMPLHLKASDQAGLQGNLIFDPVGTNEHFKSALLKLRWAAKTPIPEQYDFLGTDVDFLKSGLLVEVQFSNYPFLLNNTVRSELFFKSRTKIGNSMVDAAVIITKAHMFPASNSTLYYEQAEKQLSELAKHNVFDVPIRLVGLFEVCDGISNVLFTEYHNPRYSRTVVKRVRRRCRISAGRTTRGRCTLAMV